MEETANVGLARVAQLERLSKLIDGQLSVARLVELVEAAQQPLHVLEVKLEELRGGYVALTWWLRAGFVAVTWRLHGGYGEVLW